MLGGSLPAEAIGTKMLDYLVRAQKNAARLGAGECSHLASQALRYAGGEFIRPDDSPQAGDYVWGALVTVIEVKGGKLTDSNPSADVLPGDIIQFRNVALSSGKSYPHHTAVVAHAAGKVKKRPTAVYEQNVSGRRYCVKNSFDYTKMKRGWLRIYRPVARQDADNVYKFAINNTHNVPSTVEVLFRDKVISSFTLSSANTTNAYSTRWVQIASAFTSAYLVSSDGYKMELRNGECYYVYKDSDGKIKVSVYSPDWVG